MAIKNPYVYFEFTNFSIKPLDPVHPFHFNMIKLNSVVFNLTQKPDTCQGNSENAEG